MTPVRTTLIATLSPPAGTAESAAKQDLARTAKATQLMLLTVVAIIVLAGVGWAIVRMTRLRYFGVSRPAKKNRLPDPWREAGRRLKAEPSTEPDEQKGDA